MATLSGTSVDLPVSLSVTAATNRPSATNEDDAWALISSALRMVLVQAEGGMSRVTAEMLRIRHLRVLGPRREASSARQSAGIALAPGSEIL